MSAPPSTRSRPTVTLVCCSYNRLSALQDTVPSKLALHGVDALLFVLDGSTDGSAEFLRSVQDTDPRVQVVLRQHAGVQAARNFALSQAATEWVVFVDDDDLTPPDFVVQLLATAHDMDAQIVGAPWVNATQAPVAGLVPDLRASARTRMELRDHPSTFLRDDATTPFLCANVLAHRAALTEVGFDPSYRGNSWREETDLFLRAAAAGITVARSQRTYSWQERSYAGGQGKTGSRIRTEFWIAVNEWRFLRRHRVALSRLQSTWHPWPLEWAKTVVPRVASRARGLVRRALPTRSRS